jgi:hypothetical protein
LVQGEQGDLKLVTFDINSAINMAVEFASSVVLVDYVGENGIKPNQNASANAVSQWCTNFHADAVVRNTGTALAAPN